MLIQKVNHLDITNILQSKKMNNESYIVQLWQDYKQKFAPQHMQMLESGQFTMNDKTMKFSYDKKGKRPSNGYALIIGLHGGGGCTAKVNDQEFKKYRSLYQKTLPEGIIWFTPRSCEDEWDMWSKEYLEEFFLEIVRAFVLNDLVDINKVYLVGISAGGDGIYRLSPRLADRLAGAAVTSCHPGGVHLFNIRNMAFSIQCGQRDDQYNKHYESVKYIRMMNQLAHNYGGFKHQSEIHIGLSNQMSGEDGKVFSWLLTRSRNPYPSTILFKDNPAYKRKYFYYIAIGPQKSGSGGEQIAVIKQGNKFRIISNRTITVFVNRLMVNPKLPITIVHNGTITMQRPLSFKSDIAQRTFFERLDPYYTFEDEFVSEPPCPINMKTAICNEFDLDIQEKQAQYEKTLPSKVEDLPSNFNKSLNPLVKREKNYENEKEELPHQFMGFNQGMQGGGYNYGEGEVVTYQQHNQANQWEGQIVQYREQNQNQNQNQFANQNSQIQKGGRQKQQLSHINPYKQQGGSKLKRREDQCCTIF